MKELYVLITHERSGIVREAFNAYSGIRAFSCDLAPAEDGRDDFHIQGDAVEAIRSRKWDFIGMHPECKYLTVSGLHWNNRGRGWENTEAAWQHVQDCRVAACDTPGYLENSIGILSTRWRKPDQIISPHRFGHDASKATCLWLRGVPKLVESGPGDSQYINPRWHCSSCKRTTRNDEAQNWVDQKGRPLCRFCANTPRLLPRWGNQTDSGQNKLPPSETRSMERARTYPGIAQAMAAQWVPFLFRRYST